MNKTFHIEALDPGILTDIYLAFLDSFSDYSVPFKLTKEQFVQKFVQRLKISFESSCGVFHEGGGLAAFIFTAINNYKGVLTAYNGGTGVRPKYRGRRLVAAMYDHLLPIFHTKGIEQSVLEVLTTNDKAIRAYESVGFEKCDFFKCYKLIKPIRKKKVEGVSYIDVPRPLWQTYAPFADHDPSFLDSREMIEQNLPNINVMEARKEEGQCMGYIIYQPAFGRINQIGVDPMFRGKGIGSSMVQKVLHTSRKHNFTVLNISEKNTSLHHFFENLGFQNQLNQYEMVLKL
ncbi:GNAT family N-acetyltransferase [Fulvivirga sp. M361]|uniref:GNAT family N-acetyltransferase n=1 Tax=Fulvivirga sp. M361 TaxID=2594266 RepID=UPI00117AD028|nr:GNAT family N-acetyltransferase [Fulvivirga sp. M361]TRX61401.1 GNAT family N-acetyltransferase [Fulvivirga sp. M361]